MQKLLILAVFIITILFSSNSIAQLLTPQEIILNSSHEILSAASNYRSHESKNTKIISEELLKIINPVTDFKAISKAVMGKYYKKATEQQKLRFIPVFKETMAKLYTKSLVKFEIKNVIINNGATNISNSKGKVVTSLTSSNGDIYSISYTLRKNKNQWLIRNIILDGINLGLTYRNQFYSSANQYEGDIDKVIDGWSEDLGV